MEAILDEVVPLHPSLVKRQNLKGSGGEKEIIFNKSTRNLMEIGGKDEAPVRCGQPQRIFDSVPQISS